MLRSSAGRAHWVALAAIVVLGAGVSVFVWQSRPARVPAMPTRVASAVPEPDSGADVIARALRGLPPATDSAAPPVQEPQTPADSAAYKQRWLDSVRGVDLTGLDARKRELFLRFANAERCTCGCGFTLAGCRASDMTCDVSGPRLDALVDSVRAGRIASARGIRARPRGKPAGG